MSFFQLFNLANILTLINLLSGCIGIVFLFKGHTEYVPYCVLVSLVADFFDGFAARLVKNPTDLGKQLDSLADGVSFGVLPACILFEMLYHQYISPVPHSRLAIVYLSSSPAFLVALFAVLRLAKFNIDTRQSDGFLGLATPAATLFIVGIMLIVQHDSLGLRDFVLQKPFIYAVAVIISVFMIIELPMFSFKFKSFGWNGNEVRYLFIILSLVLLVTLKFAAVSTIIILYILISVALKILKK